MRERQSRPMSSRCSMVAPWPPSPEPGSGMLAPCHAASAAIGWARFQSKAYPRLAPNADPGTTAMDGAIGALMRARNTTCCPSFVLLTGQPPPAQLRRRDCSWAPRSALPAAAREQSWRGPGRPRPGPHRTRGLLAAHHPHNLLLEIHVCLTADVHDHLPDLAATERPGLSVRVVVRHRRAAVAADVESFAGQGELAHLRLHLLERADRPAIDKECCRAEARGRYRRARGRLQPLLDELNPDHARAGGERLIGGDHLLGQGDVVIDVLEPAVLDVERVPAELVPVGE